MANNPSYTTIPISKETRTKLQAIMTYGETYDGIIRYLLDNNKRNGLQTPTRDFKDTQTQQGGD